MDTLDDDALTCRLCYMKLENEKLVYIFEEEADLVQKINDTLSIKVSPEDHSEYLCLDCYEKVIKHYDFMHNILKLSKENVNITRNNSFCELNSNEKTDIISKVHGDMIYTCPNCNVDLMIIISNNPDDRNTAFQVSLNAVDQVSLNAVDQVEKSMEEEMQKFKNVIDLDNTCMQKSNIIDEEMECVVINEGNNEMCESSLDLQDDNDCSNTYIISNGKVLHQTNEDTTKRLQKNVIFEVDKHFSKLQKLKNESDTTQSKPNANLLDSNYDNADDSIKIESVSVDSADIRVESVDEMNIEEVDDDETNLVRVVSINGNVEWFKEEANGREDSSTEIEREHIDEDSTKCEDVNNRIDIKPRIVCELCGTRFLSQMKYEFHMERHEQNKMDKFVCTICDKEASSENLLWDHYFHAHKSSVRYSCVQCGKVYERKSRLKSHQKRYKHFGTKELHLGAVEPSAVQRRTDLEKRQANCSLCREPITDIDPKGINDLVTCAACEDSSLSLMVDGIEMKVITPRQYHCSQCPKHFVRKERLEFHEMRHNENMNEFICSTCGKQFSAENSLYEHYLFVHKGARPHICELCGKSFQLKTRLKEHHRTHTGERPYQCDVCGQRCMTTTALKLHRKTHFSHNRYNCKICDKSFSKKQNMNEHLEKHWKNDRSVSLPQLFTCPVCMEELPTYRMLKYHMMETHQIHHQDPLLTEQKPWHQCNECHEKFKHQMSLKAHKERVHEGRVSPIFECDMCQATFKIKQMLINHIRSKHEGEKRYKCAQCRKGFNDTKSLYNHILLHTGRKPFQCEYCNISFRRKDSRDHHRRKHTGEQPYQCSDCGQTFSTYNNRSKHRKKEHCEDEVECSECGEKCNIQEIRIHLNKHLGEKLKNMKPEKLNA